MRLEERRIRAIPKDSGGNGMERSECESRKDSPTWLGLSETENAVGGTPNSCNSEGLGRKWNRTVQMRVSERLSHVARSLRDRECGWRNGGPSAIRTIVESGWISTRHFGSHRGGGVLQVGRNAIPSYRFPDRDHKPELMLIHRRPLIRSDPVVGPVRRPGPEVELM